MVARKIAPFVFGLCATLAITAPARASVDAAITGIVEDPLLHPLSRATVVIHDAAGKTIAEKLTGPDGKFSQAEVRVMCFSTPENGITPVIMWARVKRHALASVAHNKVPGTGAGPVFVTP